MTDHVHYRPHSQQTMFTTDHVRNRPVHYSQVHYRPSSLQTSLQTHSPVQYAFIHNRPH